MKSALSLRISAIRAPAESCSRVIIAMGLATVPKGLIGLALPSLTALQARNVGAENHLFFRLVLRHLLLESSAHAAECTGCLERDKSFRGGKLNA